MRISELARRHGLSRSTLLYYDRIGILSPSERTPSGYRVYTGADEERLERIGTYRRASVSLKEIQKILDAPAGQVTDVLRARLEELDGELEALRGSGHPQGGPRVVPRYLKPSSSSAFARRPLRGARHPASADWPPLRFPRLAESAMIRTAVLALAFLTAPWSPGEAQTNPLGGPHKVKNYLPHMTRPEVEDLLTRSDMVIIPLGSLEQHGTHLPIGTDYLNGVERAKLIAQRADVLVAPILMPGQSPYHMGFAGTVTLPSTVIQEVYVEAAKSLMHHGFKRFLILNAHGGNNAISSFIVDRINQETEGIAVKLDDVIGPFMDRTASRTLPRDEPALDRHGGTGETAQSLYLIPELVDLAAARTPELTLPPHLEAMLPEVLAGDPTALTVFLAEGLKDEATGKGTSAAEMSSTGVWGEVNPAEASLEQGRTSTEAFVDASVAFIQRWNELRPPGTGR